MITDAIGYVESLSRGQQALLGVGLFAATFVASLGVVSAVLVRLPATYFRDAHARPPAGKGAIIRWVSLIFKNALGVLLILVGLLLSLPGIPGQGLLTILIGVMLLDFPGKRQIERRLISRPGVLSSVNALRARFGKPALVVE
jgi:uncharacterized BrkB/YihY/UPF0761 family membrane protein